MVSAIPGIRSMIELACRGCGQRRGLEEILSLGKLPLANAILSEKQLGQPEQLYPLDLAFCRQCSLAQITESVEPSQLFSDYPYFSSYSATLLEHAEVLVHRLIRERRLGPENHVIELASNDGYLLQYYLQAGIPVLGIDPARNVAAAAEERGIPTLRAFFEPELATKLRSSGRRADVLHANNVLAHVPDPSGFIAGMAQILAEGGVAIVEVPYVRDLVERLEFDTIYHEHLFYYSITSLEYLFRRNGMAITDVERLPIHGGSLRLFAIPEDGARPGASVQNLLDEEGAIGLGESHYFRGFADRVAGARRALKTYLARLRSQGHRIAAYGAAAKGTVLLNACGIGSETIDFVADRNPEKQGRYMPGVHVPIVPPERLVAEMPDEVLILAWNFADEILAQQDEYRRRGGKFIVPIPQPELIQ
jgi:SAM-dependent methyltransferase